MHIKTIMPLALLPIISGCATQSLAPLGSEVKDLGKVKKVAVFVISERADDIFAKGLQDFHFTEVANRGYTPIHLTDSVEMRNVDDVRTWLRTRRAHSKNAGGGFSESNVTTSERADSAIVIEVAEVASTFSKMLSKTNIPGMSGGNPESKSFSVRTSIFDNHGKVAWSSSEEINKDKAEEYGKERDKNAGRMAASVQSYNNIPGADQTQSAVTQSQSDLRRSLSSISPNGSYPLWGTYVGGHDWLKMGEILPGLN